jgi:hypothetical protein
MHLRPSYAARFSSALWTRPQRSDVALKLATTPLPRSGRLVLGGETPAKAELLFLGR